MFISADLTEATYATTSIADTTTSEATIDLAGGSYVTISASDVVISLTPDDDNTTASAKTTVEVKTDFGNQVQLYLAMSSGGRELNKDGDNNASQFLNPIRTAGTLDSAARNSWGYSTDGEIYQGVPTAGNATTPIEETSSTDDGVTTTITYDIYYGIKVDSSLPSGSYSNSVTYTAVVGGTEATATADLTKIEIGGEESNNMIVDLENTLTVTTNIKTDTYGEPRVYYVINDGENSPTYQECSTVSTSKNEDGYLTITCTVTPTTTAAEGEATLYITTKGSEDDYYCTNGIYSADSSDCEAGNWKWGSFTIALPKIRLIFDGITTMQAMTTSICSTAITNETTQLTDTRDGKTYWVAKLADGNCWMTQNLDFDLGDSSSGSEVTLDADTSDVDTDTTISTAYFYISAEDGTANNSYVQTWDLGEYVIINPTNTSSSAYCGGSGVYTFDDSSCTSYFTDVSKLTARSYITDYSDDSTATVDDTTYDAHYLVGNYYSWNAATAGSGSSTANYESAANSICPKNWQLPYSGSSSSSNTSYAYYDISGSFYYLLNQYGLTSNVSSGNHDIASDPLYFVRGGYVHLAHYLHRAGYYGYYWSRVAYLSSGAYNLFFYSTGVNPSYSYYRYYGFSVRCVVAP